MSALALRNSPFNWSAFDRLLDETFNDDFFKAATSLSNVYKSATVNDTATSYEVIVPGVKKEDIKVTLERGILSTKFVDRKGRNNSHSLFIGLDARNPKAKLQDGVLTITVERSQENKAIEVAIE